MPLFGQNGSLVIFLGFTFLLLLPKPCFLQENTFLKCDFFLFWGKKLKSRVSQTMVGQVTLNKVIFLLPSPKR